ncbi:hypothetical protein NX059_001381 [Plenodomus lindquistii]|nr:hypothetical protein NX059_001381 [Plenodomus lindquistii]
MAPSLLIVGATGNTGRGVVQTISDEIKSSSDFSSYRVIALTRSKTGASAKALAALPNIEVVEYQWTEITPEWLKENNVERVFIASHNGPTHFADEGQFQVSCLNAGVKYVVRISTTHCNVKPDFYTYYPRTHWALEQMLDQPEFSAMQWTSLQPNVFTPFILALPAQWVKQYRKDGKQQPLNIFGDEHAKVGVIEPLEVGNFAAKLLLTPNSGLHKHNKKRYVLNGPDNLTGRNQVELVEKEIGTKVQDVKFRDTSFLNGMIEDSVKQGFSRNVCSTLHEAQAFAYQGKASTDTTSPEVKDILPMKKGYEAIWKELMDAQ